jgi:general nucleoside transport system ATP-binding protein
MAAPGLDWARVAPRRMPLLALEHLDKHYGAVHAVRDVSLAFEPGRLHMVAGENGAGKSTLLKMAAGVVTPGSGHVLIAGERLAPHTAREAIRRGVGMVQQHFALVPVLTALDNVMLGAEPVRSWGRLDRRVARERAEAVAREVGVVLPWDAPVETLGVGDRQRLEIVRTLVREARVIVLDEPTAVLTPGEATALYATLRKMADAGRAVIVVTHRLDEVRDHADDVSVLRQGRLVSTRAVNRRDEATLKLVTRDIMGEEPPEALERSPRSAGDMTLEVRDVRLGRALRGVTLSVRAGEIVGIAGVEGNGQRELVRVLAGLQAPDAGEVRAGPIAVVHEDRHGEGLVLGATVRDNLVLGELARFSRAGIIEAAAVEKEARARLDAGRVVPPDLDALAGALSGGNQQKVVMARTVARAGRVEAFVFAQPTRGVDIGAARAIHAEILRMAGQGKAVVVVSADLGELRALSDRILVMARGRIVGEFPPDTPDTRLGEAMLGGSLEVSA